jgi:hypothetical protein
MEKVHARFGDDVVVGIGVGIGIGIEWPLRFDDAREQDFLIDADTDTDPDKRFVSFGCPQRGSFFPAQSGKKGNVYRRGQA